MSFREKFNWVVAGVTALVLAGLGVWYVKAVGSGAALDSAGPVIAAYIVWFLVMVVGAVIIASRAPDEAEEPSDERDRMINMKAALPTMHIYGFALTGLILLMFVFDMSKWDALYAIVALQLAATLFEAAAKIRFYRMAV